MAHVSEKVKVNMLLLWCGPDGEDIYKGFNLEEHQQYDLDLIWALFDQHCEPICNFRATRWKFRTVSQAPSETLDTFYNRILNLAKQCQFEPEEEKSRLIDAVIYGTSIVKAHEKLLQTSKSLTKSVLSICRHYKSLKLHLDTIKPKSVEYLQRRHPKPKGHGRGQKRPSMQPKPGTDVHFAGGHKPGKVWKCYRCGSDVKHFKNRCPAWRNVCKKCGLKGHYKQLCGKLPPPKRQTKSVQEVNNQQVSDADQDTGKIHNNVNMINMIRSLGLHEQREAKRDNQLRQTLKLHAINVYPIYLVMKTPVFPTSTSIVWDTTDDIMNTNMYVATEKTVPVHGLDIIAVHDVEAKCAIYSFCNIAGQIVKTKQDTGAEVNVMSKCVFEKLSNGVKTQLVMNKVKTTQITGYGKNLIDYIGTCVMPLKHNDLT